MVNSFLLQVFDLDAATYVAVGYGKSLFECFRWARPLSSCCFVALETKRKSGWGICGSSWVLVLCFCVMICHLMVSANCAVCRFFTAYVVIRTVPQSIYGQTREKKNCPRCRKTPPYQLHHRGAYNEHVLVEFFKQVRARQGFSTTVTTNRNHSKDRTSICERTIQTVRNLQKTLVIQLEESVKRKIPQGHAVLYLAAMHSTWLYNRYHTHSTMGVRPCVTAKLPVLRPWSWNLILLNLAPASCYFIAALSGVRCKDHLIGRCKM